MSWDRSFYGNIVTSAATSGSRVYPGRIRVSDMGVFYFDERFILLDGPKWVPAEVDYDFQSLTRKRLRRIRGYRARWEIRIAFMGRNSMNEAMDLESVMETLEHRFDPVRGVIPKRRFYLTPPGDSTSPTLEVVKVSDPDVDTEHYNGRYIGYGKHSILVETVEVFDFKRLPRVEPIPAVLPEDGILSTSWASPDLTIFA